MEKKINKIVWYFILNTLPDSYDHYLDKKDEMPCREIFYLGKHVGRVYLTRYVEDHSHRPRCLKDSDNCVYAIYYLDIFGEGRRTIKVPFEYL